MPYEWYRIAASLFPILLIVSAWWWVYRRTAPMLTKQNDEKSAFPKEMLDLQRRSNAHLEEISAGLRQKP